MARTMSTSIRAAFGCLLSVTACTAHDSKRVDTPRGDTATKAARVDSQPSSTLTGDLPVTLPLTEHTPIGVRVGHVTIWLDSTRLDSVARALSATAIIRHYPPYNKIVAACFRTSEPHETYVTLIASHNDSAHVVDAIITSEPDEIVPSARCASLKVSGAQASNSLGLRLGMTQAEVDRLLGRGDDGEYILGRPAGDTIPDEIARASSTLVIANLSIQRDTLKSIRIHRGRMLPRYYE